MISPDGWTLSLAAPYAHIELAVTNLVVILFVFFVICGTMKELKDHIETDSSYHHPGPPYTYQEPKFKE